MAHSHRTGKQDLQFYFAAQLLFLCEDVVFRAKPFSRPSIWPCLVFSELLFQSVAAKKKGKKLKKRKKKGKTGTTTWTRPTTTGTSERRRASSGSHARLASARTCSHPPVATRAFDICNAFFAEEQRRKDRLAATNSRRFISSNWESPKNGYT